MKTLKLIVSVSLIESLIKEKSKKGHIKIVSLISLNALRNLLNLSKALWLIFSEWFVSTLLYQPVLLLDIVEKQRGDPVWTDCLVDALTLLSNLLQIYNGLHKYYHEIVQVNNE